MNSTGSICSAVATATGRGFKSRRPDLIGSVARRKHSPFAISPGASSPRRIRPMAAGTLALHSAMLSAGIVGLPNVGKSTLFNAVTRTHKAPAENYPFCTIDPNVGVVTVPDPRLERIAQISHSKKIVPAAIEFVDIAGLVKGASAGEGLGNQFLHHIREVDAIVQVVRCFEDSNVHHVSATVDPVRDIEIINTELVLADLASLQKRHDRLQKEVRAGDKTAKNENAIIEKLLPHLDAGKPAITATFAPEEKVATRNLFLLTSKPTIFACNVAESDLASVAAGAYGGDRSDGGSEVTRPGYERREAACRSCARLCAPSFCHGGDRNQCAD